MTLWPPRAYSAVVIRSLAVLALFAPLQGYRSGDPAGSIRLPDQKFYTSGPYSAFASPWSSYGHNSLQRGRDFLDSIVVQPATFPKGARIEWQWPYHRPELTGVWGYLVIAYGDYDGGKPRVRVEPKQVKRIDRLSEDISWSSKGLTSFNFLNEFYLTLESGKSDRKIVEIGLLLHPGDRRNRFFKSARMIGIYVDPEGRSWTVRLNGTFCMFVPDTDLHDGRIDLKAMLRFLMERNLLTGSEWFNGLAIGVEPIWGQGTAIIKTWDVDYR